MIPVSAREPGVWSNEELPERRVGPRPLRGENTYFVLAALGASGIASLVLSKSSAVVVVSVIFAATFALLGIRNTRKTDRKRFFLPAMFFAITALVSGGVLDAPPAETPFADMSPTTTTSLPPAPTSSVLTGDGDVKVAGISVERSSIPAALENARSLSETLLQQIQAIEELIAEAESTADAITPTEPESNAAPTTTAPPALGPN